MNKFKLDFKNKVDRVDFKYKGIPGYYASRPSSINQEVGYKGKVYTLVPASELVNHDDANFFTEDDIDLLITLRDELNIEAFPFKTKDGRKTYLFLNKNWLFDVAIRLLYVLEDAKMFHIVGSTLYIDGVEFDYKSKCSFGMCDYGEYSYGIVEVDIHKVPQMFLSSATNSGCKLWYFKNYLTMLPLSEGKGEVYFDVCHDTNDGFLSLNSDRLSEVPINEVVEYKVSDTLVGRKIVKFVIKRVERIIDEIN